MRFVINSEDTPTTHVRVPAQIMLSALRFHEKISIAFPDFNCMRYADGTFEYRYSTKPGDRIKSIISAHITQPRVEERQKPLGKYLGPKGIEVSVYYTKDNETEAQTLLENIFKKLPISEMGEPNSDAATTFKSITTWYFHQCEKLSDLEAGINAALAGISFPKKD